MEKRFLGLDISTSCTGWTVLGEKGELIKMGHILFKDCPTLWDKIDLARATLAEVIAEHAPTVVFIEESLQGFRPGMSSANTLLTLAKFNGNISYDMRHLIGVDPVYISSGEARKRCGVKLIREKKKHPRQLGYKHQTFNVISSGLLDGYSWPEKRGKDDPAATLAERVVDWALDEVDSYVIARAGWLSTLNKTAGAEKNKEDVRPLRQSKVHRKGVRKGGRDAQPDEHSGDVPNLPTTEPEVVTEKKAGGQAL